MPAISVRNVARRCGGNAGEARTKLEYALRETDDAGIDDLVRLALRAVRVEPVSRIRLSCRLIFHVCDDDLHVPREK